MKRPDIPQGCDQQGRNESHIVGQGWPEPAEASTEIGCEDDGVNASLGAALCALSALLVILAVLVGFLYAGGLNRLFNWMLS
jgi:hypothetical protein